MEKQQEQKENGCVFKFVMEEVVGWVQEVSESLL